MIRFRLSIFLAFCTLTLTSLLPVAVARPTAPQLFPYNTVVYLRVDDFPDLKTDFARTSLGAIRGDETVAPLVDRLYSELLGGFPQIQEELGVTLEEILQLPTGEVALALAVTDTARPMFAFIADVGENTETADKLIERAQFEHISNAGDLTEETIGETDVTIFRNPGNDDDLYIFIKEETVVICSSELMATHLINVWEGTAEESDRNLSDNRKFTDIMRNSVGADDYQPQISFFADPLTLVNATTRDNFQAQAVMAILPTLGVDGFKAAGGSIILAPPGFDSVAHFHLALGTPRRGVLNLLTFGSGDMTPEPWVPADVSDYSTVFWDLEKTYDEVEKLVDQVLGAGYFENLVENNVNTPTGWNLREDVIGQIDGRLTMIGKVIEPIRLNSLSRLISVKLKDPDVFAKFVDGNIEQFEAPFEKKEYRGAAYYLISTPNRGGPSPVPVSFQPPGERPEQIDPIERAQRTERSIRENFRQPQPTFAIIDGYLIVADSFELVEAVIDTSTGDGEKLADQSDFQLIVAQIKAQTGEVQPSAISFSRPEHSLKMFYDVLIGDSVQDTITNQASDNQFFRVLNSAFQDHPLPEFSELSKHLAPTGGVLFNRPSGLHYMSFSLKPDPTR
ncbi:MAG: hypothetical protein HOB73_04910 [Planctomycetaceae bacterium]|nr:hypothetical protein [Planctomycetaceae bacterium]